MAMPGSDVFSEGGAPRRGREKLRVMVEKINGSPTKKNSEFQILGGCTMVSRGCSVRASCVGFVVVLLSSGC